MHSAGFVLAGGQSRRMGADKALLPHRGHTLVESVAAEVARAAGSVTLIGPRHRYAHLNLPLLEDLHPGLGPLAGLETALSATSCDWNLVAACDLPGVTAALLETLLTQALAHPHLDVVLAAASDGRRQPLCAAYHRRVLPVVQSQIAKGHLKLLQTLDLLACLDVPAGAADLRNVNSPADWARAGEAHV